MSVSEGVGRRQRKSVVPEREFAQSLSDPVGVGVEGAEVFPRRRAKGTRNTVSRAGARERRVASIRHHDMPSYAINRTTYRPYDRQSERQGRT